MNKAILVGNIGKQPELRSTKSGTSVLGFRLATNERRKSSAGEWHDHVEWHNVVIWGNQAAALAKFVKKGSRLAIDGRIQTRSWDDTSGTKRYTTEIVASDVVLLDSRSNNGQVSHNGGAQSSQTGGFVDDDIPF